MVKLICLDWDGCVSPYKIYGKDGLCLSKTVKDREFTTIKRFRAAGIPVYVLTGDPWNVELLKARNIPYKITRGTDKEDFLPFLCHQYNVEPSEICYVGDDLFDVGILKRVGHPYCPWDAAEECNTIGGAKFLNSKSEDCVVAELFYRLRRENLIPILDFEEEYAKIKELDKTEKF